jgi:hypothetical protein
MPGSPQWSVYKETKLHTHIKQTQFSLYVPLPCIKEYLCYAIYYSVNNSLYTISFSVVPVYLHFASSNRARNTM